MAALTPHLTPLAAQAPDRLRSSSAVRDELIAHIAECHTFASHLEIGRSEEDRPIDGFIIGHGRTKISLIAGAHADEPIGPETLRILVRSLPSLYETHEEDFQPYTFVICPHINPDGEARNEAWKKQWPDCSAYIAHVDRELPGRDIEFGFPEMRTENRAVSEFLKENGPCALHMSLHGMGFAEGGMLLIDREWIGRTAGLRAAFGSALQMAGLGVHDHDRRGEKGFEYIAPGFSTTPRGTAMREHFLDRGDEGTARLFHQSSMEFVRSQGGDPLCLVTEIPLFSIRRSTNPDRLPANYLAFKDLIPALQIRIRQKEDISGILRRFGVTPVSVTGAVHLQLTAIAHGLGLVSPE